MFTEKLALELRRVIDSRELRESISQNARALVDGEGARRVIRAMRGTGELKLRRVRQEDSRLLWEWANDRSVRTASFSSTPIPWESHIVWFADKINSGASRIFIAECGGRPCGQIRFDRRPDGDWEVHISLAAVVRGLGLASQLILQGMRAMIERGEATRVHAFVKLGNTASSRAFERAGFDRIGIEHVLNYEAIHFVCERGFRLSP